MFLSAAAESGLACASEPVSGHMCYHVHLDLTHARMVHEFQNTFIRL